jgi:hypothetical protein
MPMRSVRACQNLKAAGSSRGLRFFDACIGAYYLNRILFAVTICKNTPTHAGYHGRATRLSP